MRGFSPLMATEAVWRAVGSRDARTGTVDAVRLSTAIQAIVAPLETGTWRPSLYRDDAEELTGIFGDFIRVVAARSNRSAVPTSMSAAVDAWQKTELSVSGRHDGRRNRLIARIGERRGVLNGRVRSIEKQQASVAEAERYRRWGEAIYAHLWEIEKGQSELFVDGERFRSTRCGRRKT